MMVKWQGTEQATSNRLFDVDQGVRAFSERDSVLGYKVKLSATR